MIISLQGNIFLHIKESLNRGISSSIFTIDIAHPPLKAIETGALGGKCLVKNPYIAK